MLWSRLITEYSIQHGQHTPSAAYTEYWICSILHLPNIGCLPLPASLSSLGRPSFTLFSTFPQLPVEQWIHSQLPSRLPPKIPPPDSPPSSSPLISLGHGLQVHLQTRSITGSQFALLCPPDTCLQTRSTTAPRRISKLAQSQAASVCPNSPDYGIQTHTLTVSKLARSQPWCASPSSLNHGLVKPCSWQADSPSSPLCCTSHGIRRECLRKNGSGSRRVGRVWEDIQGYQVMWNHTNCVDWGTLCKSGWGTKHIVLIYESLARSVLLHYPHTPVPLHCSCISVYPTPASLCQLEWWCWWETNYSTSNTSRCITTFIQPASSGTLNMPVYPLQTDWLYVYT